jgi:two-component system, chemotaxis family, chemotaxis protein CheV
MSMNNHSAQEILLESGTNEMEILEFYLAGQSFGINVQKLREIIPFESDKRTTVPQSLPSVLGVYMVRGASLNLVDLAAHLRGRPCGEPDPALRPIVLVCQFNQKVTGFLVDGVNQIHRVSWKDVSPMAPLIERFRPRFTASVHIQEREILIVDLEHIMAEVDTEMSMSFEGAPTPSASVARYAGRSGVKLMLAEDSVLIRQGIAKVLGRAGYDQLQTFADGDECYRRLLDIKGSVTSEVEFLSHVRVLITDIEMPKLDGLTLCRKVREELGLAELKIIMFSSLITDQMAHKCRSVGANAWISKPQIPALVELVDGFCPEVSTGQA